MLQEKQESYSTYLSSELQHWSNDVPSKWTALKNAVVGTISLGKPAVVEPEGNLSEINNHAESFFVFICWYDNSRLKDLTKASNECPTSVGSNVPVSATDSCHAAIFASEVHRFQAELRARQQILGNILQIALDINESCLTSRWTLCCLFCFPPSEVISCNKKLFPNSCPSSRPPIP